MVKAHNMWKLVGSWYVPDPSPVFDRQKWFGFGTLLALALLTEGSISPVSPVLIYMLLARLRKLVDPLDTMHLSLNFIKEVDELQAQVLLPWMIVPSGQDWRNLPFAHRAQLLNMISGLEIDVSYLFISTAEDLTII
jgi:hypothetical protein